MRYCLSLAQGPFIIALLSPCRKSKGLEKPLVEPGMFTYYPPYDLGISRKLLSKYFSCDLQRSSYRDQKRTFSNWIFTKWYSEKKKELTGALGEVWRAAAAVYTVQRMVERPQKRYQKCGTFRVHSDRRTMFECTLHLRQWYVTMVCLYILKSTKIREAHSVSLLTRRRYNYEVEQHTNNRW